jgi:hypothetical protein
MKKIKFLLVLLSVTFAFTSCDPNDSNGSGQNDDTFAQNFGSSVSKDFIGQVVDTDNQPIQNVEVKIGASTAQTDENGIFIINGASVHEKFAYIKAKKSGYFDGSRSMVPTSGKNNVRIMLIANNPLQTVQSGVDSEVALPSGTKVAFDGEFEDENGNAYSGAVSVSMFHLLPSDGNIAKLMPGMLYAQTATNQQAVLETFGMLNVELRGSTGQKLNIKEGHTAEITLKIDDSQMATAPNSIPLWHFDEAKGYWKEDGAATKVGNNYVGEVSHFSWWNCDASFPNIILNVRIVDVNGNPLSNVGVGILGNGNIYPVMGYTNNQGLVSGSVPANQTLTLNVYPDFYTCNSSNIVYSTSIGPFATTAILPDITIGNSPTTMSSNVVGTLVQCNNANVTNGYVVLKRTGGLSFSPVTNGAFNFNEIYCPSNTEFTLKGVDIDNLQQSDSIHYNFTTPIINVGSIQTCTTVDEFISYQIDSSPTVSLLLGTGAGLASQGPPYGFFAYANDSNQNSFHLTGTNSIPGVYNNYGMDFWIEGSGISINGTTINPLQLTISQFGIIGQYVDMTFGGTYMDFNGVPHTLNGVVHLRRDN